MNDHRLVFPEPNHGDSSAFESVPLSVVPPWEQFTARIANQTSQLETVSQDIAGLDTNDPRSQPLNNQARTLVFDIRNALIQFDSETRELARQNAHDPAIRTRRVRQQVLGNKFATALVGLRSAQESYQKRARAQVERQYRVYVNPAATTDDIDAALRGGELPMDQIVLGASLGAQTAMKDIHTQHARMIQVQQNIEELAQLYADMATLLSAQEETLDTVAQHVETTNVQLEAGTAQMTRAVTHARKARRKKWILVILCLVLLVAIACAVAIPLAVQK